MRYLYSARQILRQQRHRKGQKAYEWEATTADKYLQQLSCPVNRGETAKLSRKHSGHSAADKAMTGRRAEDAIGTRRVPHTKVTRYHGICIESKGGGLWPCKPGLRGSGMQGDGV